MYFYDWFQCCPKHPTFQTACIISPLTIISLAIKVRKILIFSTKESLAGCQINLIDVNFHLQKSVEIFDTKSFDKNLNPKRTRGEKMAFLMPIRVKASEKFSLFDQFAYSALTISCSTTILQIASDFLT